MGFWADNFGGGNSFTESVANVFTGSDGASYVGGELQYDKDPNTVGGGGAVAVNPDGGFGVNEDGTSEYSGSANDTNTTTAATANIVTGAAPEGLSNALGFVNPIGIIGKLAGWANGLDPKTQIGEIIDGKQTYTNAEGMMYTYNFLGLPYEIIDKDGKILDKLAQKDENGKTGYEIKAEEQRVLGNNNDADAIIREGQNNAQASSGSAPQEVVAQAAVGSIPQTKSCRWHLTQAWLPATPTYKR